MKPKIKSNNETHLTNKLWHSEIEYVFILELCTVGVVLFGIITCADRKNRVNVGLGVDKAALPLNILVSILTGVPLTKI